MDQGFKSLLRGIRKAIRACFEQSLLDKGKHHWEEDKWLSQVRLFLQPYLQVVTEHEVAAVSLLLYHSWGPSKEKPVDPNSLIYRELGDEGMLLYK